MDPMKRRHEAGLFFLALLAALALIHREALSSGHYLYTAIIEDPAARYSFFPWDLLSARILRSGRFPLWNDLSGLGMPHLANLQSSVFQPLKWPYFIWPDPRALDLMVLFRLGLLGTFTFLLARSLGLSRAGAAASGAAIALSGYMMKHVNMVNVNSEVWVPFLLYLIVEGRRRGFTLFSFIFSGAAWCLVFGGGNPEAVFYAAFMVFVFALFHASFRKYQRPSGPGDFFSLAGEGLSWLAPAFFAPFILGGLLCLVQGLPFIEYLGQGFHIHDPNLHKLAPFDVKYVWSLAAPWLSGPSGASPARVTSATYAGAAALMLALTAAARPFGQSRWSLFFIGFGALSLSLVYGLRPLGLLAEVPPFNRSGNAKFAMFCFSLCLATLAGAGVDRVSRGAANRKAVSVAMAAVGLLLFGGALFARSRLGGMEPGGFMTPFLSLCLAGAFIVRHARARRSGTSRSAGRLAPVLAFILVLELSLLSLGWVRNSAMVPAMLSFRDPLVPEVLRPAALDETHPRFTGIAGAMHQSMNILSGVNDLRAFDGLYPYRYVKAMGRIEGFGMDRAVENFFSHGWSFDVSPENLAHPLLGRMGVKYVASYGPILATGFKPIKEGDYNLYAAVSPHPRAWTIRGEETGEARISSYGHDRVELEGVGPAELVLSDLYFPGWEAEVGGEERAIHPWDDVFRAVNLEAGEGRVVMTYRPQAFRLGLWSSLSTIVCLIAVSMRKALAPRRD